ncbi:MAG: hypothetical protein ACK4VO_02300 [Pseudobdellovibrio sp.]
MKNLKVLSNNKGVSLFEIIVAVGLLGIASYFAANLVMDMTTQTKKIEVQNSMVSVKSMLEGVINNNIVCTSNFKDIAFDINMINDVTLTIPLYSDPAKTKVFLEPDKTPNINIPKNIKVKNIMLKNVKYLIDATAMPVGPNLRIQSGGDYFFKADYYIEIQNDNKKSIYSSISVPFIFEVSAVTGKITKCSSEVATVVKYSKSVTGGSTTANCSDINPTGVSYKFASRILSASGYCQCTCVDGFGLPTCPGGTYREGGIQKILEPNTFQIICSDPINCSARVDLSCKINIGMALGS